MDKRVFISSTFEDLKEYRASVQDKVRQLGAIDISMENFGARGEGPKEECIRLIQEESDIFVGIYAHRYGSIPEGDSVSIIEAEYEAATLVNLPRFIYLIKDTTPWPPIHIDTEESAVKIKQFKKKLLANHTCGFFNNEDNLASNVAADLGRRFSMREIPRVDSLSTNISPDNLKTSTEWTAYRNGTYENNRGIFITHVIEPSKLPGQLYDIFIYLMRHKSSNLSDIDYAEFFMGHMWQNKIIKAKNNGGFIGILTAAYGEFLCTCRVTFTDGYQINMHRYIDFEARKTGQ
ncbi:MAG: DUF4062 domain-containing protein [Anaerolineales bacterium]|nr:DUF4062 domain-containing protein [Anaerolineales bacterium]